MRWWWSIGALIVGLGGCRAPAPAPARPDWRSPPASIELAETPPNLPALDGNGLPAHSNPITSSIAKQTFLRLSETDCLVLAAANAPGAGLFDDDFDSSLPHRKCGRDGDDSRRELRQSIRYHAALEIRNRAIGEALERFHQLAEAEVTADLARRSFSIMDPLIAKANEAKIKNVRYPLDPADLERQRSRVATQLEQLELGSRLINLDLKRRIGLPYQPSGKRLWPAGDFTLDPTPMDQEEAAAAALADRPELRGLRSLQSGLTPETLPDVRELLGAATDGAPKGLTSVIILIRHLKLHGGPDPETLAELEALRRQLAEYIAIRERQIADEARALALTLNSQRVHAMLARDRLRSWDEKLADAARRREANQPNADLLEAQVRLEWLKAKGDLAAEVAAWHRARVKLRAAMGWLVWESLGPTNPSCPALPPTGVAAPGHGASGPPAVSAGPGR
jgi:hypothetical protein